MVTCEEDDITKRCQPTLRSGFECYVYKIEPSPLGRPGFTPEGAVNLRRVYHLYNAHEEFKQEVVDIINRLDCHSVESSREYLQIMISELQREFEALKGGRHVDEERAVAQGEREVGKEERKATEQPGGYTGKSAEDFTPGTT